MAKKAAAQSSDKTVKRFDYTVEKKKNYVKIDIIGDFTITTTPRLKKAVRELIDEGNINFVFDLAECRYIDSTGLGFFIGTLKNLKENKGAMHLTGINPFISGIFQLINLASLLPIYDDIKEACKF
ncbi:MAG: STAS domain-containing protein [Candidatus Wallbacteria bacterium]